MVYSEVGLIDMMVFCS